jgi:IS605 OrfB family transposase
MRHSDISLRASADFRAVSKGISANIRTLEAGLTAHAEPVALLPALLKQFCCQMVVCVGITALVADSEGNRVANPQPLRRSSERLSRAQRHLARRTRGSGKRRTARRRVRRVYERINNQRKDVLHKLSRRYVDSYQVIVIEDLQVANLARNHHLARSIHDSSWGTLRWMLSYKAAWAGRELVAVPPHYTSQQCSSCGAHVEKALSVRTHSCPWCGYVDDRDVNAARNILQAGVSARTGPSLIGGEGRSAGPQVTHRDDGRSRGA